MTKQSKTQEFKTLEEYVKEVERSRINTVEVLKKIYQDVVDGKAVLIDPSPPKDFIEYIFRADYSLWLWTVFCIMFLTLVSIAFSTAVYMFTYVRYVLGSITVLFLPGYVTVEALYPIERDLTNLERLALSIGLSLAIVPLIGLLLNYTPWGIRLIPVVIALTIYILVVGFLAAYRKYLVNVSIKRQKTFTYISLR